MATSVNQTPLPGVGIRYDFTTKSGDRIGVIDHHTDRYDLLLYDRLDPDSCATALRLDEEEGHALAEIIGSTRISKPLSTLQESIPGLTIDWVPVGESWECAGCMLSEIGVRSRTGVSIVAVVRNNETIPSPQADFRLYPGDTAVVIGTSEGIRQAFTMLQGERVADDHIVSEPIVGD